MTVFSTVCIECEQKISLPSAAVVIVCIRGTSLWQYRCPKCRAQISRTLDDVVRAQLAGNGVIQVSEPGPPLIAGEPPTGPPINEDDLIALGLELYGKATA